MSSMIFIPVFFEKCSLLLMRHGEISTRTLTLSYINTLVRVEFVHFVAFASGALVHVRIRLLLSFRVVHSRTYKVVFIQCYFFEWCTMILLAMVSPQGHMPSFTTPKSIGLRAIQQMDTSTTVRAHIINHVRRPLTAAQASGGKTHVHTRDSSNPRPR